MTFLLILFVMFLFVVFLFMLPILYSLQAVGSSSVYLRQLKDMFGNKILRRNHALEHATIVVMMEREPGRRFNGFSDDSGFFVQGVRSTGEVDGAAREALRRLQAGEAALAIHPRCGTNLAVAGILTGVSSFLASLSFGKDERAIDKLPRVILAATAAVFIAQPAGLAVQEAVTTCPDALRLSVGNIRQTKRGNLTVSFVEVKG